LLADVGTAGSDGLPDRVCDGVEFAGLLDCLIDGLRQPFKLCPLLVSDGLERLRRELDVGADEAGNLAELHLERDHGDGRADGCDRCSGCD